MNYLQTVQQLLMQVNEQQQESIERASKILIEAIIHGGIIQLFGSGHSQLVAQEGFYRASGLACVKPISIEPLMLHTGALSSSQNEKDISNIEDYWSQIDLQPHDVLIVISTSGRNAVPIEIAHRARQMQIPVITLQSLCYIAEPSLHASKKRLEHFADVVIDTLVPVGDGLLNTGHLQYGPVSTVMAVSLLNQLFVTTINQLQQQKQDVPIFKSANVSSSSKSNDHWIEHYRQRINFG